MAEIAVAFSPSSRHTIVEAATAGVALGLVAQVLRQVPGETMQFGAATAPWLSIGFALSVWAAARRQPAGRVLLTYLVTWLVAYHVLYALGQSVPFSAAFREALPWLLLALPVSVILTPVARLVTHSGLLADACLAVPIAWSVPETVGNAQRNDAVIALAIALLALAPIAAARRRDIRITTVVLAALLLAALALLLGPIARGQIHS